MLLVLYKGIDSLTQLWKALVFEAEHSDFAIWLCGAIFSDAKKLFVSYDKIRKSNTLYFLDYL